MPWLIQHPLPDLRIDTLRDVLVHLPLDTLHDVLLHLPDEFPHDVVGHAWPTRANCPALAALAL